MASEQAPVRKLDFPPLHKSHILNCSYHEWHSRYRRITPKARLIPLSAPFLSYLRSDGIFLPPENQESEDEWSDLDSGIFSSADNASDGDDDEEVDPSLDWPDVHTAIASAISDLGGKVVPKLNWSSPKDATWISATNSMDCRTPNDIYLLLKSSDFITHDLEHALDDCVDVPSKNGTSPTSEEERDDYADIPYYLVLRKYFLLNPSLEFRCFVRRREVIALCQRDLNHFEFLFDLRDQFRALVLEFFETHLKGSFPDENFVFDVYMAPSYDRVWLIDINPWAIRTDPLLFSWQELLTFIRSPSSFVSEDITISDSDGAETSAGGAEHEGGQSLPEFRLIRKDDPEAYGFNTPQYSAHKLPRDVVDASRNEGGALREFATAWKDAMAQTQAENDLSD